MTPFFKSLIQRYWIGQDAELAAEKLAQDIMFKKPSQKIIKIIWDGFGPIEKKLMEALHRKIPNLITIGYIGSKRTLPHAMQDISTQIITLEQLPDLDFDMIILADIHKAKPLIQKLLRNGIIPDKIILPFQNESYKSQLGKKIEKTTQKFIRTVSEKSLNKKVIFFVVMQRGSFPSVEFFANSLSENSQFILCAVYFFTDPPEKIFDVSIHCNGSFHLLTNLLKAIPSHLIYVQSHFKWIFLSQFVQNIKPECSVVHEINDWMEAFIDNSETAALSEKTGLWSKNEIKEIVECENYILNHMNGFIYKNGGEWMHNKIDASPIHSLHLLPCPPKRMMRPPVSRRRKEFWRLVFAGRVAPTDSSDHFFNDIKLLPLVRELTHQSLKTTIWNSPIFNNAQLEINFFDYCQESRNNEFFQLEQGTPIDKIVDHLNGHFDFGLMLYYFIPDLSVGKNHLACSMASKLFTYIAAGLPILISPELKYMSDFVKIHGIGLVIECQDIPSLKSILNTCDYIALINNMAKAQKKYCAENNTEKLLTFINSIIGY